jgi:thioredoxin-dependent peroxiredoxin
MASKIKKSAKSAKAKPVKPAAAKTKAVTTGKAKGSAKGKTIEVTASKVKKMTKPAAGPKPQRAAKGGSDSLELIGMKAPAFTLADQDDNPVSLASLTARGNVVLYFYPKDMTPGCTVEAGSFRDNLGEVRALGAEVVGVSADSTGSHQKFIAKQSLNFPLLSDPGNTVTKAYGVFKKKSLYGRVFMGIERTTFIIGRDGTVKRVFPKVKVNGHTDEVLAALKQLG